MYENNNMVHAECFKGAQGSDTCHLSHVSSAPTENSKERGGETANSHCDCIRCIPQALVSPVSSCCSIHLSLLGRFPNLRRNMVGTSTLTRRLRTLVDSGATDLRHNCYHVHAALHYPCYGTNTQLLRTVRCATQHSILFPSDAFPRQLLRRSCTPPRVVFRPGAPPTASGPRHSALYTFRYAD